MRSTVDVSSMSLVLCTLIFLLISMPAHYITGVNFRTKVFFFCFFPCFFFSYFYLPVYRKAPPTRIFMTSNWLRMYVINPSLDRVS
ncbi:uncharacterized protein RJT21DRAFT_122757 [Scheffersomyces amazonensis]|uniref:uncharacterized protein n=1 Tax=Scheffersomyces amazonensis TaxID=1078765 RepID=UPI00315D8631